MSIKYTSYFTGRSRPHEKNEITIPRTAVYNVGTNSSKRGESEVRTALAFNQKGGIPRGENGAGQFRITRERLNSPGYKFVGNPNNNYGVKEITQAAETSETSKSGKVQQKMNIPSPKYPAQTSVISEEEIPSVASNKSRASTNNDQKVGTHNIQRTLVYHQNLKQEKETLLKNQIKYANTVKGARVEDPKNQTNYTSASRPSSRSIMNNNSRYERNNDKNDDFEEREYQEQVILQKSTMALKKANEMVYFIVEAYKNCIEKFTKLNQAIEKGDPNAVRFETLALNFIIDNAYAQFKTCSDKFPQEYAKSHNELLTEMRRDFQSFYEQCSKKKHETLNLAKTKFEKILKLESVDLYKFEPVKSIDPKSLLETFFVMQQSLHRTDNMKEALAKEKSLRMPLIKSTYGKQKLT